MNKLKRSIYRLGDHWHTFCYGVRNLWRFRSVVWHFRDFDYAHLLRLLAFATGEMAVHHRDHGCTVDHKKIAQQLQTVSALCRRLEEDEYFLNAGWPWQGVSEHRRAAFYQHVDYMAAQDVEYLCRMLRKVRSWWD